MKIEIVACNPSKFKQWVDFEDSGSLGSCRQASEVNLIIRRLVSKCDDFEFRKVKNYKLHEKMKLLIYLTHNDSNYHLLKFKIVAFRDQLSDNQFNFRCMSTGPKTIWILKINSLFTFWRAKRDDLNLQLLIYIEEKYT